MDGLAAYVDGSEPCRRQDNRLVAEEVAQGPQQRGFAGPGPARDEQMPCFVAQVAERRLVFGGWLDPRPASALVADDAGRLRLGSHVLAVVVRAAHAISWSGIGLDVAVSQGPVKAGARVPGIRAMMPGLLACPSRTV